MYLGGGLVRVEITIVGPIFYGATMTRERRQPLGIAYLAAVLEKERYKVTLVDPQVQAKNNSELVKVILSSGAKIIGITTLTSTFQNTLKVVRQIKRKNSDAFIVLGGPHATATHSKIIKDHPFIDAVVRGEGEYTFRSLVMDLEQENCTSEIAGVTRRNGDRVIVGASTVPIMDLDNLPFPARHLLPPLKEYDLNAHIVSSRGCPWDCSFCSINQAYSERYRRLWRARSPQNVSNEMDQLVRSGAQYIGFADDNFLVDPKRVRNLVEEMKRRKIEVKWGFGTRADLIVKNKNMLSTLSENRCVHIELGMESGCQKVLDRYDKGTTTNNNEQAVKAIKDSGITFSPGFIMFDADTTLDELETNLRFIEKNDLVLHDEMFENSMFLIPGTRVYDEYVRRGLVHEGTYGFDYRIADSRVEEIRRLVFEYFKKYNGKRKAVLASIQNALHRIKLISRIEGVDREARSRLGELRGEYIASWVLMKMLPYKLHENAVQQETNLIERAGSDIRGEQLKISRLDRELGTLSRSLSMNPPS